MRDKINSIELWMLLFLKMLLEKKAGNTAQNYSILFKKTLNLLKNESSKKTSMKGKRLEAGWNESYLLRILNLKV